jgi:sodium/pantothenate symporter
MDIYTGGIVVSILIYIAIGNYAGRGVKNLDDYYVAGRRAPTLLIVGTLVASLLSTNTFLGESGFAYEGQAGPFILWPAISAAGYIFGALFFGRYLRRSRAITVADFFGQRFNSRRVQSAAGVSIVLALGGYLVAVTQGAAVIISQLTEMTYIQGLVVSWFSYTLFTLYSGSRGVILTDTLMFLLFTFGTFLATWFIIDGQGGWVSVMEELVRIEQKPELMSWHGVIGEGTEWANTTDYLFWNLIMWSAWGVVYAVSPWQSSRHLMARNEHVVLRSACIACLCVSLMPMALYVSAAAVNLSNPDILNSEETLIWAAKNLMPEIVGATLLAGIMAAALSSASTFLSLVGFSANNDIVQRKETDEQKRLKFSRLMMLVIGAAALAVSLFFPPSILWLTYFVGTVFASSWGPVAIMSVWSNRITADAAFWGIISGFIFNVVPKFFDYIGWIDIPAWMDPIVIGGVVSLVVVIVVSRMGSVTREERQYRMRLHRTPGEEISRARTKQTLRSANLLVLSGVLMPVLYLIWYIRPYQSATGTLRNAESIDFFTGEVYMAFAWALLFIPLGLLTRYMTNRSYVQVPDISGKSLRNSQ